MARTQSLRRRRWRRGAAQAGRAGGPLHAWCVDESQRAAAAGGGGGPRPAIGRRGARKHFVFYSNEGGAGLVDIYVEAGAAALHSPTWSPSPAAAAGTCLRATSLPPSPPPPPPPSAPPGRGAKRRGVAPPRPGRPLRAGARGRREDGGGGGRRWLYRHVQQEIMKISVDVAVVYLWRKLLFTENAGTR
ncbi:uncharacterized protein LOC142055523 isoform X2 [Phalacrocorax aristotelis]|uniref:uncharacterized protein LOC142055523 isoform X2 n=1 Tax=Phalacrocorax aristotelis TaxID=126867 RepID=UPI003F4B449B